MREGTGRISNHRYRARQMRRRFVVSDRVTAAKNRSYRILIVEKFIKGFDFKIFTRLI